MLQICGDVLLLAKIRILHIEAVANILYSESAENNFCKDMCQTAQLCLQQENILVG